MGLSAADAADEEHVEVRAAELERGGVGQEEGRQPEAEPHRVSAILFFSHVFCTRTAGTTIGTTVTYCAGPRNWNILWYQKTWEENVTYSMKTETATREV